MLIQMPLRQSPMVAICQPPITWLSQPGASPPSFLPLAKRQIDDAVVTDAVRRDIGGIEIDQAETLVIAQIGRAQDLVFSGTRPPPPSELMPVLPPRNPLSRWWSATG